MSQSVVVTGPPSTAGNGQPAAAPVFERHARSEITYHLVLLALCAGTILLACLLSVREQTQVVLPVLNWPLPELCLSRRALGWSCPGCGLTRCFIAFARGDVASAWSFNPAGVLLFVLVAVQIPYRAWQVWRIARGHTAVTPSRLAQLPLIAAAVALVVQWLLRFTGLPFWPL
jgi:Protein of unknown function (DUF2752)